MQVRVTVFCLSSLGDMGFPELTRVGEVKERGEGGGRPETAARMSVSSRSFASPSRHGGFAGSEGKVLRFPP